MIFHYDQSLYMLVFLPLLAALFFFYEKRRKRVMREFGNPLLLSGLSDSAEGRRKMKMVFFIFGVFFLVLGASRPQFGTKERMVTGKGVDVMVAIDTSKSMYAEDVKPNRFEKARFEVTKLSEKLRGNSIGLIAFAGRAFPECPMTVDLAAFSIKFLSTTSMRR
ncbi:MAG: VWA domain-containing protein [Nitrospinota bacterium]